MSDYPPLLSLSGNLFLPLKTFTTTVLLIDDQKIIAEAVKHLLSDQSDIMFHYCPYPSKALSIALKVKPSVILQDLMMPEIDGLALVQSFREHPATKDIPIIVLSVKEEPQVKAEAFAVGANDYLVKLPDRLELIARIRYHSNAYIRLLERNDMFNKLEESQKILLGELSDAAVYVKSVLPEPLKGIIEVDWRFIPSTQLGGDAFGYHWLNDRYFVIYLLDVCGHGVGAALHAVSVINVLRSRNLPRANFYDPSSVLTELNRVFQMEDHNNMFFTIWYGLYDKETRNILYASGGHPPAILITGESPQNRRLYELKTPGIVIGALPEANFENATCNVKEFNSLYVFSDGVYEVSTRNGSIMNIHEFIQLLMRIPWNRGDALDSIVQRIQHIQGKTFFADDFSLLQVIF